MGWETRKGRLYYYRKERAGGKVVSRYIGRGAAADAAARLGEELLAVRRREREQRAAERQIDRQVQEVCDLAAAFAAGALVLSGYHLHRGQWRRRSK